MLKNKVIVFTSLISISILLLGIGYAALGGITLELNGIASVKKNDSISITNVEYESDNLADTTNSLIINYNITTINSSIVLGDNKDSTITYKITLKNDTDYTFKYADTIHNNNSAFYDNPNIEYSVTGIKKDDKVLPGEEKIVLLTFKYKTNDISNNILNSYINIKFNKIFEITYINIDDNNLINSIEENGSAVINLKNKYDTVQIDGDLDYSYNNGIINISNVKSNLKITGREGSSYYTASSSIVTLGSTINTSNYETENEIGSPYLKYTVDSNNNVIKIESCKKKTSNANAICLTAVETNKYENNKEIIINYFGGDTENIPSECQENKKNSIEKITCENTYVILSADNEGSISINDKESNKTCLIDPNTKTASCN